MLSVEFPLVQFQFHMQTRFFSNLLSFLEVMASISSSMLPHLSLLHLPCCCHSWVSSPTIKSLAAAAVQRGARTQTPAVGCRKGEGQQRQQQHRACGHAFFTSCFSSASHTVLYSFLQSPPFCCSLCAEDQLAVCHCRSQPQIKALQHMKMIAKVTVVTN